MKLPPQELVHFAPSSAVNLVVLLIFIAACHGGQSDAPLDRETRERLHQFGASDPLTFFPRRNPQAAFKEVDGQVVVAIQSRQQIQVLNETGSKLFLLLDGRHSVADMAHVLVQDFEIDEHTAMRDTIDFLVELRDKGMLAETTNSLSSR